MIRLRVVRVYSLTCSVPVSSIQVRYYLEPGTNRGLIDVLANGQVICPVSIGNAKDIDIAVKAARTAYKTSWGLKVPGAERGRMLSKFADLVEEHSEELAALESLNVGAETWFTLGKNVILMPCP